MSIIPAITSNKDNVSLFRRLNIYIAILLSAALKACKLPAFVIMHKQNDEEQLKPIEAPESAVDAQLQGIGNKVCKILGKEDQTADNSDNKKDNEISGPIDTKTKESVEKQGGSGLLAELISMNHIDENLSYVNSLLNRTDLSKKSFLQLEEDKRKEIVGDYLSKEFDCEKKELDEKLTAISSLKDSMKSIAPKISPGDDIDGLDLLWLALNKNNFNALSDLLNDIINFAQSNTSEIKFLENKNPFRLLKNFSEALNNSKADVKLKFFLDILAESKKLLELGKEFAIANKTTTVYYSEEACRLGAKSRIENSKKILKEAIPKVADLLKVAIKPVVESQNNELFNLISKDTSCSDYMQGVDANDAQNLMSVYYNAIDDMSALGQDMVNKSLSDS